MSAGSALWAAGGSLAVGHCGCREVEFGVWGIVVWWSSGLREVFSSVMVWGLIRPWVVGLECCVADLRDYDSEDGIDNDGAKPVSTM